MTREELNQSKQDELLNEEKKAANREKRKKTILFSIKVIFLISSVFLLFYVYTTYVSSSMILVKEKRVVSENIPASFNGTKVIHFSDLHYGSNINLEKLVEIVGIINERRPDIVVFTGDLIDKNYKLSSKELEKFINEFKKIDASIGKYAVSGDEDLENYSTIMLQCDFTLLNNSYDLIYKNSKDFIMISGVDSLIGNKADVNSSLSYYEQANINNSIYSIGIFHEPDTASEILNKHNTNLLLGGHSHNGNIRVPFIGAISKVEGAKIYNDSYYEIDNSKLFISSGLGTKKNSVRLFSRPSINFIRLSNK